MELSYEEEDVNQMKAVFKVDEDPLSPVNNELQARETIPIKSFE